MEVRAEKAKIWRRDYEGKNGTFHRYSVSVSKKNDDGEWINAYIPVLISKKAGAPQKIDNGTWCSFEGFFSVESYTDKDGKARNNPMIVITKIGFDDPTAGVDSFEQADDDIPF